MNKQRPVFLTLTQMHFPVTAIISILHRISGVIVFLFIPLLLWLFHQSMTAQGFEYLHDLMPYPLMKLVAWGMLAAILLHLIAGIRHLLMDMHIGETLQGGRFGAWLVIVISILFIILAGIWLW